MTKPQGQFAVWSLCVALLASVIFVTACSSNSTGAEIKALFDFYRTKPVFIYKATRTDTSGNVAALTYERHEVTDVSDNRIKLKTTTLDRDEKETESTLMELAALGNETLTTPGGSFDCVRIEQVIDGRATSRWIDKRWNLDVKSVSDSKIVSGFVELTEFRVSGAATDEMAVYRKVGNTWMTRTTATSKQSGKTDVNYSRFEVTEIDEGGSSCKITVYDEAMKEKYTTSFYHDFPMISDERITTPAGEFDCRKSVVHWKTPMAEGRKTTWTDKKRGLEVRSEGWSTMHGTDLKELIEIK